MSEYLVAKWIHLLSSTILFGTGIGSAFYMFFASRQQDPRVTHFVVRYVVIADWVFTTTAIVIQPVTGIWLAHLAGFPLGSRWLAWSIALYFVAGACWLPVVWMQVRMRDMARTAAEQGTALPERYRRFFRIWVALGIPAFLALVAVFYLMVAKPA
ncbi:MAG TPA: DUF2269 domain-containing protein [Usitatibacter sp.]|nr:DUF2269 domain-containing protein [Usitatibacter sp.]